MHKTVTSAPNYVQLGKSVVIHETQRNWEAWHTIWSQLKVLDSHTHRCFDGIMEPLFNVSPQRLAFRNRHCRPRTELPAICQAEYQRAHKVLSPTLGLAPHQGIL